MVSNHNKILNLMKKLFFVLISLGVLAATPSCKKCGYCKDQYGQSGNNGSAVCSSSNAFESLDGNSYDQAKTECSSVNGVWVNTK